MIFQPYYLGCLSHASYLIGDEETHTALVVDPQRDVEQYVTDAAKHGLVIRHVILTHFHADFVAGHIELAARTGATIHLGAKARAEYAFHPLKDGDEVRFGQVAVRALETPGHTPESITLLVLEASKPRLALTGDTLFVGDVGRPDLMASAGMTSAELAGQMYDSVHTKLAPLGDDLAIWPAHGAGSMCGKSLSNERSSTIGAQRKLNWAFQPMSREQFVKEATSDLPPQPAYFGFAADMNRRTRPTLEKVLENELKPLALDALVRALNAGQIVLDVREPDEFARGHLAGSINIGLSGKYASWCGILLDRTKPIVLVAGPGKEREAAMRLGRIGFDHVAGFLDGGAAAWKDRPDLVRSFRRHTPETLRAALATKTAPLVLDVRAASEHAQKHIEPSVLIPLDELERRARELPRNRAIAVHCASGYRSSIAESLLERVGLTELSDLAGGINAWSASNSEVTGPR